MRLTAKDKEFLERLQALTEQKQLSIEMKEDGIKRLVLRGNYGERIEREFGLSRQGVRWRFQRLFNGVYVEAYERILWIESMFGNGLRHQAMAIAKERVDLRRQARKVSDVVYHRRQT
jgi:hypothetical protein